MTYSIIARDAATGEMGVAVQSRAFGTGASCAWARAGAGAVATQSFTEKSFGPRGLELMRSGTPPETALAQLLSDDELAGRRQVALLDVGGRTAAHTGADCIPCAGHAATLDVSVQGNMLRSEEVWPAMTASFAATTQASLAERLLAALDAAEEAGGDFRGQQAAGLIVVPIEPSAQPATDRVFDLRVDDHPEPLAELRRLHRMAAGYRRLNRIEPGASVEGETEAARAAGLPQADVDFAAVLVHAQNGDVDQTASLLTRLIQDEPLYREAFIRHEQFGLLPVGVVARLEASGL